MVPILLWGHEDLLERLRPAVNGISSRGNTVGVLVLAAAFWCQKTTKVSASGGWREGAGALLCAPACTVPSVWVKLADPTGRDGHPHPSHPPSLK